MIKIKELRSKLKNPLFLRDAKELQKALKNANELKIANRAMFEIIKECHKKGIEEVTYNLDGKEIKCNLKEQIEELGELKHDGKI